MMLSQHDIRRRSVRLASCIANQRRCGGTTLIAIMTLERKLTQTDARKREAGGCPRVSAAFVEGERAALRDGLSMLHAAGGGEPAGLAALEGGA